MEGRLELGQGWDPVEPINPLNNIRSSRQKRSDVLDTLYFAASFKNKYCKSFLEKLIFFSPQFYFFSLPIIFASPYLLGFAALSPTYTI